MREGTRKNNWPSSKKEGKRGGECSGSGKTSPLSRRKVSSQEEKESRSKTTLSYPTQGLEARGKKALPLTFEEKNSSTKEEGLPQDNPLMLKEVPIPFFKGRNRRK